MFGKTSAQTSWLDDRIACIPFLDRLLAMLRGGSVRARFANGAIWSLLGAGISQTMGFVAGVVTARLLGKTGFGEFGMIQSTIAMFGVFAGLGLGMTATRHVALFRKTDPARAGRIITLTSVMAIGVATVLTLTGAAAANWLALHTMNAPDLAPQLRLGCGLLLVNALSGAQMGVLSGLESFKAIAKVNIIRGLINLPATVTGVYFLGLTGAVAASVCVGVLTCLISMLVMQTECRRWKIALSLTGWKTEFPVLWRFSLPVFVSSIMLGPVEWAMNAILVNQPGGYDQLGLFSAAKQWFVIMLYLPNMVSGLTFPMLSNLWGENCFARCKRFMIQNTGVLLVLTVLVTVPVGLFAGPAMRMYGNGFSTGTWVLLLMCVRALTVPPNMVTGQAVWVMGSPKAGVVLAGFKSMSLFLLFLMFLPFGALGMAAAFALGDFILMIIQVMYLRNILGRTPASFASPLKCVS